MNRHDIKALMAAIAHELVDTDDGAHWLRVQQLFDERHGHESEGFYAEIVEDYKRLRAKEAVAGETRKSTQQIHLPGIGDFDYTITYRDGEGGYHLKTLRRGNPPQMRDNVQILADNAVRAVASHERGVATNAALLPIMESEGFATAGEAIDFLNDQVI